MAVKNNVRRSKEKVKVGICDKILWNRFLQILGVISSIVTLISFFVTGQNICVNTWFLAGSFIAVIVIIFTFMWFAANRKDCAVLKINKTIVKVAEGDIWELLNKKPQERIGEISVIGVNDFYDVIVDDRIIAANSLHGQYIKRITQEGKLEKLNRIIASDIILNKPGSRKLVASRKVGKRIRYELGTAGSKQGL